MFYNFTVRNRCKDIDSSEVDEMREAKKKNGALSLTKYCMVLACKYSIIEVKAGGIIRKSNFPRKDSDRHLHAASGTDRDTKNALKPKTRNLPTQAEKRGNAMKRTITNSNALCGRNVAEDSTAAKRQKADGNVLDNDVKNSTHGAINQREHDIKKKVGEYEEFLRLGAIANDERDDAIRRMKDMERERDAARQRESELKSTIQEKDKLLAENDRALQEKEAALLAKDNEVKAATKERDDALKRIECFVCLSHENDLFAFTPCGHVVCSDCKNNYNTLEEPCPKCQCSITGRNKICI